MILIKNAKIITVNSRKEILENTDILVKDGIIVEIAPNIECLEAKIIDASDKVVLPGFIQTHVHLCQTLFRGMAERMELLNWLRDKIWPLEALNNEESLYYSSLLGLGELISGGTTTILDMGSVKNCDSIFEALKQSGIRAFCGKAMMDAGDFVPENLLENTDESFAESVRLYEKYHNCVNGRIKYAFAPRFVLSVSDRLFSLIKDFSQMHNVLIHTHAYENKNEGVEVQNLKGLREFEHFEKLGILSERFLAAHCVWINDHDKELIKRYGVKILHCPSSNFKLGSGMLNIMSLIKDGISVSIGSDGAPCNNSLDMLKELRTTALLQSVLNSPAEADAYRFIEIATIEGAKALGIDNETGSIEKGKKADIIFIKLNDRFGSWHLPNADLASRIVFGSESSDVSDVIIDGNLVMEDRQIKKFDEKDVLFHCGRVSSRFADF